MKARPGQVHSATVHCNNVHPVLSSSPQSSAMTDDTQVTHKPQSQSITAIGGKGGRGRETQTKQSIKNNELLTGRVATPLTTRLLQTDVTRTFSSCTMTTHKQFPRTVQQTNQPAHRPPVPTVTTLTSDSDSDTCPHVTLADSY